MGTQIRRHQTQEGSGHDRCSVTNAFLPPSFLSVRPHLGTSRPPGERTQEDREPLEWLWAAEAQRREPTLDGATKGERLSRTEKDAPTGDRAGDPARWKEHLGVAGTGRCSVWGRSWRRGGLAAAVWLCGAVGILKAGRARHGTRSDPCRGPGWWLEQESGVGLPPGSQEPLL